MNCPNCRASMAAMTLDGHLGRPVVIDVCHACHAFWFDGYESLQLAPRSVLALFRVIGSSGRGARPPVADAASCPRCQRRLLLVKDLQRRTRFEYRACPDRHGRLTSFYNFLREKDFIKPLSPEQVEVLKRTMPTINCSNCGGPVDLAKGTACGHCGSPLSMLDVGQAEALIEKLKQVGTAPVDPAMPLTLERAKRDVIGRFRTFERDPGLMRDVSGVGLVEAGVHALAALLTDF